jgi:DNA-binding Lrp family transcriptional regulator
MELTSNDKKIYEYLFYDARRTTREIARLVGIKQPSVQERIKKMETNGFIRQYDSLINTNMLPFIHKMYYCTLTSEQEKKILSLPQCVGMQLTFNSLTHQLFMFYRNQKELKKIESQLPKVRIEQLITKSHRLGGSIFDFKRQSEKYSIRETPFELDKIDIAILNKLIHGGARRRILDIASELKISVDVVKYRKKKLIDSGYFLYFIAQPGTAFSSIKIIYHVFDLTQDISIDKIASLPRQIIAYSGDKQITVIQVSLDFDEYLKHSAQLFRVLKSITKDVHSFFIDKPVILNKFREELFFGEGK